MGKVIVVNADVNPVRLRLSLQSIRLAGEKGKRDNTMTVEKRTVYRPFDDILRNPEKYLGDLSKFEKPYVIKTGIGFEARVFMPHDCGCEHCDYEGEDRIFQDTTMERILERIHQFCDDADEEEIAIESIKECFYAEAVSQNYEPIALELICG